MVFNTNFKQHFFLYPLVVLTFAMCGKGGSDKPASQSVDVYAAGTSTTNKGVSVATFWKNGVAMLLADSTVISSASGIVVVNGDVYISGTITDPIYGSSIAVYWKNGLVIRLNDHFITTNGNAIAVSGSDVYVAGNINFTTVPSIATYWKNGVANQLSGKNTTSTATAIALNGNDIYVSGNADYFPIVFWKNGILTNITDGTPEGGPANGIFLTNSDVYILSYGCYWKNGVRVTLSGTSGTVSFGRAITGLGNDIYVVGSEIGIYHNTPCYWKNNIEIPINDNGTNSDAFAITTSKNDIYIGGYTSSSIPGYNKDGKAAYWKNGTINILSNLHSEVDAIAVVSH